MANSNSNAAEELSPETSPSPSVERPQLTKKQKKELFATFAKAEADLTTAKEEAAKAIEAAEGPYRAACEAIYNKLGKGPFRFQGRILTAAKNRYGGYMKGLSTEVEDI